MQYSLTILRNNVTNNIQRVTKAPGWTWPTEPCIERLFALRINFAEQPLHLQDMQQRRGVSNVQHDINMYMAAATEQSPSTSPAQCQLHQQSRLLSHWKHFQLGASHLHSWALEHNSPTSLSHHSQPAPQTYRKQQADMPTNGCNVSLPYLHIAPLMPRSAGGIHCRCAILTQNTLMQCENDVCLLCIIRFEQLHAHRKCLGVVHICCCAQASSK